MKNSVDPAVFGLWTPLLDCYLLFHHDPHFLQKIQTLTVNKILTCIVYIEAETEKLVNINNQVASTWTVKSAHEIPFTQTLRQPRSRKPAIGRSELVLSTVRNPEEVIRVQTWLLFVAKWILYIEQQYWIITDFTQRILHDDSHQHTELSRKIYQILLLENDPTQAEIMINQAIDEQNNSCQSKISV